MSASESISIWVISGWINCGIKFKKLYTLILFSNHWKVENLLKNVLIFKWFSNRTKSNGDFLKSSASESGR